MLNDVLAIVHDVISMSYLCCFYAIVKCLPPMSAPSLEWQPANIHTVPILNLMMHSSTCLESIYSSVCSILAHMPSFQYGEKSWILDTFNYPYLGKHLHIANSEVVRQLQFDSWDWEI